MVNFKNYSYFTPERLKQTYLFPNVCFACRKSFRRPLSEEPHKCPECGASTVQLSRKFKAPKKEDFAAWRVVEYVVSAGFMYQTIYLANGQLAAYPKTMKEAEEFVRLYRKKQT